LDRNVADPFETTLITTERLILRPWKDEDVLPYAEMNADPRVREFFPSLLTREHSDAEVRRFQVTHDMDGYCMFAAELISTGQFAGFIGLQTMSFVVPSVPQPAVEIGWRLSCMHWGKGLATEGARGENRNEASAGTRFRSPAYSRGPPHATACPVCPQKRGRFLNREHG
jgi:hypothetical protein